MMPDIGPLILFGVWCFCVLAGLACGVVWFLVTNDRVALLVGPACGWAAYLVLRRTTLMD